MNKTKFLVATIALLFSTISLSAQSLSDIVSAVSSSSSTSSTVSDIVSSVTGGLTVSASSIAGEWDYVEPAVELSSESLLTSAAGSVVSSQIESKLDTYCSKVGISAGQFAYVFSSDGTFTSNIGSKSLGGTYTVDSDNSTITLNYTAISSISIGSLTASTTLTSTSLSLLFPADKLLTLFSAVASASGSSELATLSALTEQYDGISLGFSLSGEAVTTTSSSTTSSTVQSAVSALSNLF